MFSESGINAVLQAFGKKSYFWLDQDAVVAPRNLLDLNAAFDKLKPSRVGIVAATQGLLARPKQRCVARVRLQCVPV